jgi:cytochrome c-type biogenesis protein CcmF
MTTEFVSKVLGVLGLVSGGFSLFIITTSNPFERLIPAVAQGRDLNPLLQDPAMAAHPPMLYAGYVGLAVPFACALAALMEGKLDAAWARWAKPWAMVSWMFLTCGIALGSFWAYYELGWGGWWFWDPVENASFMPWLMATALIHSLSVTEKRSLFKSWTVLLAIFGFSLSLLGTFLVRSGVLVSIHSFASDPARGLFILVFLLVCIGGALTLFAWRAPALTSNAGFKILSRESFLLLNNVLLVVAATLILIGTLYPLIVDVLGIGKISVGMPVFNAFFLVAMYPLLFLLAIGMHASWKQAQLQKMRRPLLIMFVVAVLVALSVTLSSFSQIDGISILKVTGLVSAVMVMLSSMYEPIQRWRNKHQLSRGVLGMSVAHFGLGVFVLGVTIVSSYKIETDLTMGPGKSASIGGYEFNWTTTRNVAGPNYDAVEAEVHINKDGKEVSVLHPQKRVYHAQPNPMTEAGIASAWHRDLLVSMGDELGNGMWSVRLQYKPMVRFIWIGALIMAIGGFIAVMDRRYRVKVPVTEAVADGHTATAGN